MATPRNGYDLSAIPRYVQFTSPVAATAAQEVPSGRSLPLNLIARIVSYLDDVGDLARVTRSSRLLHYMTTPRLYERVTLRSYTDIRFFNDGRPEGFGSGSPFIVALNGIVTGANAAIVRDFRLRGQWKEFGLEEFDKGRIPDNNMMLNIIVRIALDRMVNLRSFAWELDTNPLKNVYQGLALRTTLTSLTLKFPTRQLARPAVLAPPIPSLHYLKVTDIDPLCYPDDMSTLILHARKLVDLRLHFSPRMRQQADPSMNLAMFFAGLQREKRLLSLRHVGVQNFFGRYATGMDDVADARCAESAAFLDSWGGGNTSNLKTVYIDNLWLNMQSKNPPCFKRIRLNEAGESQLGLIRATSGMQYFYFVNARTSKTLCAVRNDPEIVTPTTSTTTSSPFPRPHIGKEFVEALAHRHGSTLKHLLLSEEWPVDAADLALIVRLCPNLEQFGFAPGFDDYSTVNLFLPFLHKLQVVRFLALPKSFDAAAPVPTEDVIDTLGRALSIPPAQSMKIVGTMDAIYKIGKLIRSSSEEGVVQFTREVSLASHEAVEDVELWKMDTLDIDVDPYPSIPP